MVSNSSSHPEKPILLVTHPRAISTAFERIFVTREDDVVCVHEPFADAYHWGPEKVSERYQELEKLRKERGYETYTYHTAFKLVEDAKASGKRVFVKDHAKTLMPLPGQKPFIVPSLRYSHGGLRALTPPEEGDVENPTLIPPGLLSEMHITFLIRNPQKSIPSLYQLSIPPKSSVTGWHGFKPVDAGYYELRRLFDHLRDIGQIGPETDNKICLVDADDLLSCPQEVVAEYCSSVRLPFTPDMLKWETKKDQDRANDVFKNWAPFHDVVLKSSSLQAQPPREPSPKKDFAEWAKKYGFEAAQQIQNAIEDNMEDYLYLKQFAIKPHSSNCKATDSDK